MAQENMLQGDIDNELARLGETGNAKIKNGGLYVQREENADWQYVGTVFNEVTAKKQIEAYFNQ